jgi:hypothetical protein
MAEDIHMKEVHWAAFLTGGENVVVNLLPPLLLRVSEGHPSALHMS